jgi:hypothetical protein
MKVTDYLTGLRRSISARIAESISLKAVTILLLAFAVTFLVARMTFFSNIVVGDQALVTLNSGPILQEYSLQAWNRGAYGENYPSPLAYLIIYLFSQMASYTGAIQVFSLMMNLSFPLSFISFYFFSGKFCKSFWFRVFGSAFYIVNPVVLTYYSLGGFMWALVFLPLALSFFIDFLEKHSSMNLIKATALASLTMWVFPSLSVVLILILITIAISYFIYAHPKTVFLKATLPRLAVFFLVIIALNASYLYSQYGYYQSPSFRYEGEAALRDFSFTYQSMTLANLLTFSGNIASPQVALGYTNPSLIANEIGIVIPAIAFASALWLRKDTEKKRAISAMLLSLAFISFLTLLIRFALYAELDWIITSIPELWTLRNPIKLQLLLAVCMIPLFIFSLEKITASTFHLFRQKNYLPAFLVGGLVFLGLSQIYLYNTPAFNGYAGMDLTYGSSRVYIPNQTLLRIVNDSSKWYSDGTYRGMILPFDHNAELHVQFTNPLLYASRLDLNSQLAYELADTVNRASDFSMILSLLSTKYLYINNAWTDTGFQIIQPKNISRLTERLFEEGLTEEAFGDYSKFEVDEALPRLYLSNDPIFFSNVETIGQFNDSILRSKPIFIKMKNAIAEQQTESPDPLSLNFLSSYNFELLQDDVYDVYAITHSGGQETPLYFTMDKEIVANLTLVGNGTVMDKLSQIELKSGVHTVSALASNVATFRSLSLNFSGGGAWNDNNGTIRVENGTLTASEIYEKFDLQLEFKPIQYGQENWNGPEIFFNVDDSSHFRLVFHNGGYVELAQLTPEGYQPGVLTRKCNLNSGDAWNRLRIIKNADTFVVYLNDIHLLSYSDASVAKTGKVAIGSDGSSTAFRDVNLSKDIVAGFWLLPAKSQDETPFTLFEMTPDKYRFEFNQTGESPIIFLGENYDAGWEASVDGKPLSNHFEANLYANSWSMNTTSGTHQVEISYKHNPTYQILVNVNIAAMGALINIAFFPAKTLSKIRFRRENKKKTNETTQTKT